MLRKMKPVESLTFDGMADAVAHQAEAAAVYSAEELSAKLVEPRQSINAAAGKMEQDAPLFYGTIHWTLF